MGNCCEKQEENPTTTAAAPVPGAPADGGAVPAPVAPVPAADGSAPPAAAAGAAPAAADPNAPEGDDMVIAVHGGGGKSGKVEVMGEAVLVTAPNDPQAIAARKSHKKDKSGQDFDSRRKEYVFDYLNKEGGYVLDPANKKAVIKVEPGTL